MPDEIVEPENADTVTEPKPSETVDFWKQKAREQEKRAKANAEAAVKLAELERAKQSDTDRLADLERRLAEADAREQRAKLVQAIAGKHGITDPDDVALFLTGPDEGTITAQAARLAERDAERKRSGNRVPAEGRTPTNATGDDDLRAFTRQLFERE